MDTITKLAELAFASRLKRLSERLMKDVSLVYRNLDIGFEARWFSILYALDRQSPKTITSLAKSLRLTHTAVNQLAAEMMKKGLLISIKGKKDERQRLLQLSDKGRVVVEKLTPVWKEILLATKELIDNTGVDFLSVIAKLEKQLDEQDMYERVWLRLKGKLPGEVEISEYRPAWKKYFNSLNREWIEEYFEVENEDEKILADPNRKILKKGGCILFAILGNEVVGACALINHRHGVFELSKMAVTKKYQRMGIGRKLVNAILEKSKALGASAIYLQTSPELETANSLYKNFGFYVTEERPFGAIKYNRPTYILKKEII